jgi:hypothetical protein
MSEENEDDVGGETGRLLATVRFADTRWLPGDWTKALFIYERCLIYSGGRSGDFIARSVLWPFLSVYGWYDDELEADAHSVSRGKLVDERGNWIVWSHDVTQWDVRAGLLASRLRLTLADGTREKVLWGRMSNSLPEIRTALRRSLPSDSRSG